MTDIEKIQLKWNILQKLIDSEEYQGKYDTEKDVAEDIISVAQRMFDFIAEER